jgi:putative SOS response-associated peptidase YedK
MRKAMCNLYSMTKPQQAISDLVRVTKDMAGNLRPLPGIRPDMLAPVVIQGPPDRTRQMVWMRWGFPHAPPQPGEKHRRGYVTNVRHTDSVFWRPYLLRPELRCLVPATSSCEPDNRSGTPVWTWFALDESRPLFFFAGIWRTWTGARGTKRHPEEGDHFLFSFLTTAPNAEVAPIHPKAMPVLLLNEEARETWLNGTADEALRLQRPAPTGTVKIVRAGDKEDPA